MATNNHGPSYGVQLRFKTVSNYRPGIVESLFMDSQTPLATHPALLPLPLTLPVAMVELDLDQAPEPTISLQTQMWRWKYLSETSCMFFNLCVRRKSN